MATLLRYHYGRPTVESDVFSAMWRSGDQAQIKRAGFSMLDMKRYLDSQGYMADGYRMPLDQLAKLKTPAIALI
ncbi:C39 family peptidase, partial [Klebsiella pneumoniae]|uniref:C39 family peptidase n=1 Tax=Klebsiella pneumoniae TaxID=573 RepID=UPI0039C03C74